MKDIYSLNQETLPIMPTPHDNVVNHIFLKNQFISFFLDTNINDEDDAIRKYHPEAESLIIRYHLTEKDSYSVYKMKKSPRHLSKLFPPRYKLLDGGTVEELAKGKHKLEYLFHYVGDNSIIIRLFSEDEIVLVASVDYIEYEWIC